MKLTDKQAKFCWEYVIDLNATKAAIRAGFNEKTAYSQGCRLLKNVEVQDKIRQMQHNLAETAGITSLRVLKEHEKIAFSSIAHIHQTWIERTEFEKLTDNQKACIRSISTKIVKRNIGTRGDPEIIDIEYVKIELFDKQKSLDSISNILGFNAPVKRDLKVDFTNLSDTQIDLIINKLNEELSETED